MANQLDIHELAATLYFLPVETRVPLKFGPETLTSVTCARVCMTVQNADGRSAQGWGETPLSVQWVWPGSLTYAERHEALKQFCERLAEAWTVFEQPGHPLEIGHAFQQQVLPELLAQLNQQRGADAEPMPWLAALVCCSAFDIALHDAYGILHGLPIYECYQAPYMNRDLSAYLEPLAGSDVTFSALYPADFFVTPAPQTLLASGRWSRSAQRRRAHR